MFINSKMTKFLTKFSLAKINSFTIAEIECTAKFSALTKFQFRLIFSVTSGANNLNLALVF